MEADQVVSTEPAVAEPIAFKDAVYVLQQWAQDERIDCPVISAEHSVTDDAGNWLLYSGDEKLIARVGRTVANGPVRVL